ncbi:MAG: ATP-binding protein [Minicystis sp.]
MTSPKGAPAGPQISPTGEHVECRVVREADVVSVQYEARWLAERAGFPRNDATEFAIVAVELTTNVLKYGKRGSVVLEVIEDPVRGRGARVVAFDEGPPFTDFEQALSDGSDENGPISASRFGRRRGIASGLGAVHRLSDKCGWEPETSGKRVWAERWPRRRRR